ncbi:MAG TPA: stage II sporulation protein R [Symbiobacteriaceae bacterium]|nr:stage II sporulation protein R [Symbiobacteriaceae bacterium]
MNRRLFALLFLVLLGLLAIIPRLQERPTAAVLPTTQTQAEWAEQVVRLHVLANSDSEADQALKLQVRDAVLAEMPSLFTKATTQAEALQVVKRNLPALERLAKQIVTKAGYTYPVKASVGIFDFPNRTYGDVTLPAGPYEALRLEIGEAKGANWWCVLFPPLCFNDWTHGVVREAKPGTGGAQTVTKPRPQMRSKLMEWLLT